MRRIAILPILVISLARCEATPQGEAGAPAEERALARASSPKKEEISLAGALQEKGQGSLVRPFEVGYEYREGIDAHSPSSLNLRCVVPAEADLHLSHGISQRRWEKSGVAMSFLVSMRVDGKPFRGIYSKTIRADETYHGWTDVVIPLDAYAGERIDLVLQVVSPTRNWRMKSGPFDGVPVWSDVRIARRAASAPKDAVSVLWLTLDTVRADHVGCYGYAKPTTPTIDRLAAGGWLFERAISDSSWTRPSVASMLFSSLPHRISPGSAVGDRFRISPDLPSVQEAFQQAGYVTTAITNNHNLHPDHGFLRGFESYYLVYTDEHVFQLAEEFLSKDQDPYFLYLQPMGPHHPYAFVPGTTDLFVGKEEADRLLKAYDAEGNFWRNPPTGKDLEGVIGLYDSDIRVLDGAVDRIVSLLRDRGKLDTTFLVITSDHGEEFGDHGGWTHGHSLYDELLRVPLVFVPPAGEKGRRFPDPVGLIHIAPTVLDAAGIQAPKSFLGRSLLKDPSAYQGPILSESLYTGLAQLVSIRTKTTKYIIQSYGALEEVYDLTNDPGEKHNLSGDPDWLQTGRSVFKDCIESLGRYVEEAQLNLLFFSDQPRTWQAELRSDAAILPILYSVEESQASPVTEWSASADLNRSVFQFPTGVGQAVQILVPAGRETTELAARIKVDGREIGEGDLVLPNRWPHPFAKLVSNLVSPEALSILRHPGQPDLGERRGSGVLVWSSTNIPFLPSTLGQEASVQVPRAWSGQ